MRIETYPNGGGEVLHMWYDEIKDMNEADQEKVASEFIEEAFIENEEGYARYCCAIVHNAVSVQGVESLLGDCRFILADWGL